MSTLAYRNASEINSAMIRVYNNMLFAVLISFVVSALVSSVPALMLFFFTGIMQYITIFAPLAVVLFLGFKMQTMSKESATLALYGFSALMGLSMASIFIVFTIGSIISAFMGAAVLFATMSFYGYFTKKDLTSIGQFMFVGLIAIVIASVINVFVGSSVATMVISALAIVIFLGLTAYDTQRIRQMVSYDNEYGSAEIMAALSLYLNFINIFIALLQLFGNRND
jgi:FtsH-binding integral membrane protein